MEEYIEIPKLIITKEIINRSRKTVIEARLDVIDIRRLRPKEELVINPESIEAKEALDKLDQEKAALRAELQEINKGE